MCYNIPMENTKRKLTVVFLIVAFAVFNVYSFSVNNVRAETEAEKIQDKLKDYADDLKKEEAELKALNSQSYKNQAQISATTARINKIKSDMASREAELKNLSAQAELNKKLLGEYIRQLYYAGQDNDPLVELALFNGNLDEMVSGSDSIINIKEKINDALKIIAEAKIETEEMKKELEDKRIADQKVLNSQQSQQNQIAGDIKEQQLTIADIQKKMSKLRSALSSFLDKSFTTDDVVREVKYASGKTGVRKEFIFAILDKETDLGRYTGGCYYSKGKNAVKGHMKSSDKTEFIKLMDELGYGKNDKKLSCWPGYGYGGAMGVAQFMPSTWIGYKSAISNYTGNNPPNPWNLKDGIMGMAEKLKRAGATSKSKEHYAAKVYYCGGPSSIYWKTRCEAYANTVISWSKGYDEYF